MLNDDLYIYKAQMNAQNDSSKHTFNKKNPHLLIQLNYLKKNVLSEHFRLSPEPTEHLHDKQNVKTKDDKVTACEVQRKIRTVDQFFSQVLFPAFEHECHPQTWRYRSWARETWTLWKSM